MPKHKKSWIALLLLPLYGLIKLASNFPNTVEVYYSKGLYPIISKVFRFILGWLPFSFGDLLYGFLIITVIRWLVLNRKRSYKDTFNWGIEIVASTSILIMAFHLFWGFNYYRNPLHKNLNLNANYTTEQLILVTQKLISKSNQIHFNITQNDTLKVVLPFTKKETLQLTPNGYKALSAQFTDLSYTPIALKQSLFSTPLTYMGFSGYLNPLTNEAHLNERLPIYKFPTTAAHEIAHQLGYAKENEANFIGFLATINNDNLYFRYSGYTYGLIYCLSEINKRDPELYQKLLPTIHLGIIKNYQEVANFWTKHQNPLEPIFKKTYGSYLKANNQSRGMESYNYVVALLVNYLEDKTLDQ